MKTEEELRRVREFCDNRAQYGRVGSVRDPNDRRGLKNEFIETTLNQAMDEVLELDGDACVLDIGCGSGLLAERLAPRCGRYVGLDVAERMLELAREAGIPGAEFVHYDGVKMPLEDDAFDLALTREVIHLMSDEVLSQVAGECSRVLRPGGRLLSIEFCSSTPKRQDGTLGRYERAPEKIIDILQRNGMRCIRTYPVRRGRSVRQYLLRYGLLPQVAIPTLAGLERARMRPRKDYVSSYNADHLFIFEQGAGHGS